MKPTLTRTLSADELARAPEKDGKKIAASVRISEHGKPAITHYIFADGTDLTEQDDGKKVKWPEDK